MKKLDKNLKKLISFFKQTGYYDEKSFNYIFEHIEILDDRNYKEFDSIDYWIKDDIKGNKLRDFYISIPKITDINTMLFSIYIIAHAISKYENLNKEVKYNNLKEVLPVSLVRIYLILFGSKKAQLIISYWQKNKLIYNCTEELLIAYDLQFLIADCFINYSIMLLPDSFYIDDVEKAKSEVTDNIYTMIEKPKAPKN